MAAPPAEGSRRRLGFFYASLALVVAAAAAAVIAGAGSAKPQPAIAGGYDVSAGSRCLGPQVDVIQSGQFVSLAAPAATKVQGKLRLKHGRVTGTVTCADGRKAQIVARPAERALAGTLGGAPLAAALKRDPPPAGTARPRVPDNLHGDYTLTP
ncbi:MAG: hypothetical protein QOH13_749, partial [Thermoleophilaceae bacterium]|nr:hypothetical protein [Thermoleophilaceae bacterium]